VRDNTTKHTLLNVLEVPEVVINIVTYDMVQQASLASCEFGKGTDEFVKAGFTKKDAVLVQPPVVAEAKAALECRVVEVKSLGEGGGAGQLVICEVLCIHINDELLNEQLKVDPAKLNWVARLGGDWYCSVTPENLFQVEKPNMELGIGVDALPAGIRQSDILTGNHLGQLANVRQVPLVDPSFDDEHLRNIVLYYAVNPLEMERELHTYAVTWLQQGKVQEAWQVLLAGENS
jgi:flavin reductase (DIM6/NTAB) family NADH-FMN oxidoreductase RutF